MARNHDPRLEMSAIRARYNDPMQYKAVDSWHRFTAAEIEREIVEAWHSLSRQSTAVVLNAGAGGNDHFSRVAPHASATINVDISEKRISGLPSPIVASIEALPLLPCTVDIVVCVGSVINYCDAAAAIAEFGRVVVPGGQLILEFESSLSAELITQDAFSRSAAIAETFYGNQPEAVWVYAPTYT